MSGGVDGVRGAIYGVSHVMRSMGVVFAAFDATSYPPASSLETLPAGSVGLFLARDVPPYRAGGILAPTPVLCTSPILLF